MFPGNINPCPGTMALVRMAPLFILKSVLNSIVCLLHFFSSPYTSSYTRSLCFPDSTVSGHHTFLTMVASALELCEIKRLRTCLISLFPTNFQEGIKFVLEPLDCDIFELKCMKFDLQYGRFLAFFLNL